MSSIYDLISVKMLDGKEAVRITKIQYLRLMSNGANGETDEQIQQFFDTFNI